MSPVHPRPVFVSLTGQKKRTGSSGAVRLHHRIRAVDHVRAEFRISFSAPAPQQIAGTNTSVL
jgi:hypothetical protein